MRRQQSIPIGRILGIPIGVDYSWFLIFALLTFSLSTGYYPERFAWPEPLYWGVAALTVILLFGSVLLHELGHAVAAMIYHIPVLRIRLMLFGGVAEMGDDPPNALSEFVVALAGPFVSLLVAGVSFAGYLTMRYGVGETSLVALQAVRGMVGYMALVNVMLAVFNLIPGFPLDGGRVLRAIIWGLNGNLRRATWWAAQIGRLVAFGMFGIGLIQMFIGGVGSGLWTIFIGLFLLQAARSEVQVQNLRAVLDGKSVRQAMRPHYSYVPAPSLTPEQKQQFIRPDAGLWSALRQMEQYGITRLQVAENGRILGVLLREDVFAWLYSNHMNQRPWLARP